MSFFNSETERKAGPDPSVAIPRPLPGQAVPVPQPTAPDTSNAVLPHQGVRAPMIGTHLDQGSKISGKLKFEGQAQIEGQVDGEISAKDTLVIGKSGVVTAQIKAPSVIVAGKLSGEIIASERIEIRASAKVSGNLTAPRLVVHEGAMFEGRCAMRPEGIRDDRKPVKLRKEEPIPAQANSPNRS